MLEQLCSSALQLPHLLCLPLGPLGLLRISSVFQNKPEWIFCPAPEPGAAGGAGGSYLAGFEDIMVLNAPAVPANRVILPHYVLMKQNRTELQFSGVLSRQG